MTLISIVCLLALSSVALARPYGGYGAQPMQQTLIRRPIIQTFQPESSGYGQIEVQPAQPRLTGYGQSFIGQRTLPPVQQPTTMPLPPPPMPLPLTRADVICRGKLPETVIVMEDKRGVFVCLDDTKGEEILCQPGLWYHEGLRRCERTLGPIPNACDSQPCLNGGQCFQDGSHYQCQCAPGFDGTICELDARVCQTQQPCGSQPGTRCQSFRPNAALQYICVHQNGFAYGFNAQQVVPSPCKGIDGAVALSITDKGVAYCDGDRMSLESCVDKTHWDDQIKACIWDDETIPGTIPSVAPNTIVQKTFVPSQSSYGEQLPLPQRPKVFESYGEQLPIQRPKVFESYGEQLPLPQAPKMIESYGEKLPTPPPKVFESYGEQLPTQPPKMIESFGEQLPTQRPKMIESFGEQLQLTQRPKLVDSYGTISSQPRVHSFGTLPQQPRVHSFGTIPQQSRVNTFGTILPSQQKVNQLSNY